MGLENGTSQKYSEMIGQRFGRLTVMSILLGGRRCVCVCECDCGVQKNVRRDHLVSGKTVSCGCYQREITGASARTHGMSKTRLYGIWKSMQNRCSNENIPGYFLWGGRGIAVCPEWKSFETFRDWALANGYRDDLSLDRVDNDGNYDPKNCKWATRREQARNRRSNAFITYNGITKHISDWDKDIGVTKSGRVRARLNAGWSVEEAVTVKVGEKRIKQSP